MSKHFELVGISLHLFHLSMRTLGSFSRDVAVDVVACAVLCSVCVLLAADALKMPFRKFNSALISFRLFSQSVFRKH